MGSKEDAAEHCLPRVRTWCRFWFILILASTLGCSETRPPCSVELPVYDPVGNRLDFEIAEVRPENEKQIDLLAVSDPEFRMTASGDRLYFPRGLAEGAAIYVTLRSASGVKMTTRVALLGCRVRVSLQNGQLDNGADVGWDTIGGRLSGCSLDGDWWVRGMRMFGGEGEALTAHHYIDPADGSFWLGVLRGVRYIVVIGKGSQPVRTLATNVISGGENDVGTVDLTGLCPE
jgi:hypothetical protein